MKNDMINFRGVKEGVYLEIKGNDLNGIRRELNDKLKNYSIFFKGAKFLGVKGEDITEEEIHEIKLIMKYKYDFNISLEDLPKHIKYPNVQSAENNQLPNLSNNGIIEDIDEGMTKFVYGTLRSGQIVEYQGNIVIIGDVNPGAFLKAKGNIIVLGTLRGVAHAGLGGNLNSVVAAYNLLPTQLRIGDIIVRPPDGDISQYKLPEVAKIYNGDVVIEPYLPNK